jgi:hypothetical protein
MKAMKDLLGGTPLWLRFLLAAAGVIISLLLIPAGTWVFHVDRAANDVPELRKELDALQVACVRRDDVQELRATQVEAAKLRGELEGLQRSVASLDALVQALLVRERDTPDAP